MIVDMEKQGFIGAVDDVLSLRQILLEPYMKIRCINKLLEMHTTAVE